MSVLERRLRAEWEVLAALVACNPERLRDPHAQDTTFTVTLRGPRTTHATSGAPVEVHDIRVEYPVHFPAVPMELYLAEPVQHANIHPDTGFVCLWSDHRMSHTIEHALHRTAAMLSGTLVNQNPLHVMQPAALLAALGAPLRPAAPLRGIPHDLPHLPPETPFLQVPGRSSRLS